MNEIWKPVFNGLYEVSNLGRMRSTARNTTKGKVLTPYKEKNGYLRVIISINGKHMRPLLHRVIAKAFIPNPNNLRQINHKDENKENNHIDNLEWCTPKYNANYGTRNKRVAELLNKPVNALKNGKVVLTFNSLKEAESQGFQHSCISHCCNGKRKRHQGYEWQYA